MGDSTLQKRPQATLHKRDSSGTAATPHLHEIGYDISSASSQNSSQMKRAEHTKIAISHSQIIPGIANRSWTLPPIALECLEYLSPRNRTKSCNDAYDQIGSRTQTCFRR